MSPKKDNPREQEILEQVAALKRPPGGNLEDSTFFKNLPAELLHAFRKHLLKVDGTPGRQLTPFSREKGVPHRNPLILVGDDGLEVDVYAWGKPRDVVTHLACNQGDVLREATWLNGVDGNHRQNLVHSPAFGLRLSADSSWGELPPLEVLAQTVPLLKDPKIMCEVIASVGTSMSQRLVDLNARRINTGNTNLPEVPETDPSLVSTLCGRQKGLLTRLNLQRKWQPEMGQITVVKGGGWVVGTKGLGQESLGTHINGADLHEASLAKLSNGPIVLFPSFTMDGIDRQAILVGTTDTEVATWPLPPNDVEKYLALARVMTGQSAGMAKWVADTTRLAASSKTDGWQHWLTSLQGAIARNLI